MEDEIITSTLPPKSLQEGEEISSQECKDLISTLPKEKGWPASHMYKYQGFWYLDGHIQGVISCQKHFKAQDSDIFLVSIPKSGTTWLRTIMFSLINRKRHEPLAQDHPLLKIPPHALIPIMEIIQYANNKIPDFSSFTSPRLFATHMPFGSLPESVKNNHACKIVYLCRNPKDVIVSLWHFANKMKPVGTSENPSFREFFDRFCDGKAGFGPWWDHVLEYWNQSKENPNRVLFLKYEDMKTDSGLLLRRLAEFLGCPFSSEEEGSGVLEEILNLCSFKNLSSLEVNKNGKTPIGVEHSAFFRKGVVGDWKNHMDPDMIEKIDGITQQKFSGSGLIV